MYKHGDSTHATHNGSCVHWLVITNPSDRFGLLGKQKLRAITHQAVNFTGVGFDDRERVINIDLEHIQIITYEKHVQ